MHEKYPDLIALSGYSFPIYTSAGTEPQARTIAVTCERAYQFLITTLNAEAQIRVLVLAPNHWQEYADYPIYGMPHFVDIDTLIVAGNDNDFWRSAIPPVETLPPEAAQALANVYGQPNGSIDLSPFFHLLAVHEMEHLFHCQASVQFPRHWLKEFFCNLVLHTYVAGNQPAQLPILETFPELVASQGHVHFAYHTLEDFERLYVNMGAENYVWYQCQLSVAARRIYDAGGIEVLQRLWNVFMRSDRVVSDEELAQCLKNEVQLQLTQVLTEWPCVRIAES